MLRSELIERMSELYPYLTARDVETIVRVILDEISSALERGDRIELRGFGSFSVRLRQPRIGRNPRTGLKVEISDHRVTHFKPSREIHKRLNGGALD